MWSVGGRFGWLATPDTMWYALAAYTQGEYNFDDADFNFDVDGWCVGAGVETRLRTIGRSRPNTGSRSSTAKRCPTTIAAFIDLEPSVHTARVLLSYRINPFERSLESYK